MGNLSSFPRTEESVCNNEYLVRQHSDGKLARMFSQYNQRLWMQTYSTFMKWSELEQG